MLHKYQRSPVTNVCRLLAYPFGSRRCGATGRFAKRHDVARIAAKRSNVVANPFERADHNSNTYWDWMIDKAPQLYLGLATTAQFLQTFAEYPPSQTPDSWSVEKLTRKFMQEAENDRQ